MARADKLLERMRGNPLDWQIAQIETICAGNGVTCKPPRKGSHYKVSHESQVEILTIPAHRPINPVYIRDFVAFIDAVKGAAE